MNALEIKKEYGSLSVEDFRKKVTDLEKALFKRNENVIVKERQELDTLCPLTHSFSEGIYVREMFLPKDTIAIGKIHNKDHTWFLIKGSLLVATEEGVKQIKAPVYFNSKAGCKRLALSLEDSVFINVHPNPNNITDVDELEKELVCSSYEQYEKYKQIKNK